MAAPPVPFASEQDDCSASNAPAGGSGEDVPGAGCWGALVSELSAGVSTGGCSVANSLMFLPRAMAGRPLTAAPRYRMLGHGGRVEVGLGCRRGERCGWCASALTLSRRWLVSLYSRRFPTAGAPADGIRRFFAERRPAVATSHHSLSLGGWLTSGTAQGSAAGREA